MERVTFDSERIEAHKGVGSAVRRQYEQFGSSGKFGSDVPPSAALETEICQQKREGINSRQ
jgi:hypothetical protein